MINTIYRKRYQHSYNFIGDKGLNQLLVTIAERIEIIPISSPVV